AGRDAYFNITEGQPAALGQEASLNGQTVALDLSAISAGTTATLIVRLVNNDTDHNTSVAITCVQCVGSGGAALPWATPAAASAASSASPAASVSLRGSQTPLGVIASAVPSTTAGADTAAPLESVNVGPTPSKPSDRSAPLSTQVFHQEAGFLAVA